MDIQQFLTDLSEQLTNGANPSDLLSNWKQPQPVVTTLTAEQRGYNSTTEEWEPLGEVVL